MTASAPLAHYGAVGSALASGFAFAELHHHQGHDLHEELVDNESIYKGMFNKRAEIHFIGVLNGPKNPTHAGVVDSPNLWEWRPAEC
jgi:hypothetical protein